MNRRDLFRILGGAACGVAAAVGAKLEPVQASGSPSFTEEDYTFRPGDWYEPPTIVLHPDDWAELARSLGASKTYIREYLGR